MPTITQTNKIEITPERFIEACSTIELYELEILLNKKLNLIESTSEVSPMDRANLKHKIAIGKD